MENASWYRVAMEGENCSDVSWYDLAVTARMAQLTCAVGYLSESETAPIIDQLKSESAGGMTFFYHGGFHDGILSLSEEDLLHSPRDGGIRIIAIG